MRARHSDGSLRDVTASVAWSSTNTSVLAVSGSAVMAAAAPGLEAAARFSYPYGVAPDSIGNVYVADTSHHTIRKISPAGEVGTLTGTAGQSRRSRHHRRRQGRYRRLPTWGRSGFAWGPRTGDQRHIPLRNL